MPLLIWLYFTEKTIIAKPLDCKFTSDEKQEILTWRNIILSQKLKIQIDDPTKDNFTQSLTIKEILDELEMLLRSNLSISKDDDY